MQLPEVIELTDDDDYRGVNLHRRVVRGHHDPMVAMHAILEYLLGYEGGDIHNFDLINFGYSAKISYRMPEPKYALWTCGPQTQSDGFRYLTVYDTPGRGRFKVMVAERIERDDRG